MLFVGSCAQLSSCFPPELKPMMIVLLTMIQLYVSNCVSGQQLSFICQNDKLRFDYPSTQNCHTEKQFTVLMGLTAVGQKKRRPGKTQRLLCFGEEKTAFTALLANRD